jgi:hypothetical protein
MTQFLSRCNSCPSIPFHQEYWAFLLTEKGEVNRSVLRRVPTQILWLSLSLSLSLYIIIYETLVSYLDRCPTSSSWVANVNGTRAE